MQVIGYAIEEIPKPGAKEFYMQSIRSLRRICRNIDVRFRICTARNRTLVKAFYCYDLIATFTAILKR